MKYIGVDLGGTHIGAGIVDMDKGILYKKECPTLAHRPYEQVRNSIVELLKDVISESNIDKSEISSIGIGIPGIETPSGESYAVNLFWEAVPLRKDLTDEFDLPVHIDNDAHAAALAELGFGSLKGYKNAIMLTLGTGVGGAMIVDGKILSGHNNAGGELGHITFVHGGIPCSCGRDGCFEKYASATALIRLGKEYAKQYPSSVLHTIESDLDNISAKNVVDSAREGDVAGVKAFDDYCEYLSQGIISFINILNPQIICLGGGLSLAGDILFDKAREICKKNYLSPLHESTECVPAQLKNDAGILGAAMVAKIGFENS